MGLSPSVVGAPGRVTIEPDPARASPNGAYIAPVSPGTGFLQVDLARVPHMARDCMHAVCRLSLRTADGSWQWVPPGMSWPPWVY